MTDILNRKEYLNMNAIQKELSEVMIIIFCGLLIKYSIKYFLKSFPNKRNAYIEMCMGGIDLCLMILIVIWVYFSFFRY